MRATWSAPDGRVTTIMQTVEVDLLRYDFGPQQFAYLLRFENAKMVSMRTDGYGASR